MIDVIWKTRITRITNTKYPLIMAAFWRYGITEFAASFSNAGGFGTITALNYDVKEFRNELKKMKELTTKPFGVNVTVNRPRGRADADAKKKGVFRIYRSWDKCWSDNIYNILLSSTLHWRKSS